MINTESLRDRAVRILSNDFSTDLRIKARKLLELADMFDNYTEELVEEDEKVLVEIENEKNYGCIKRKKDIIAGKRKLNKNMDLFGADILCDSNDKRTVGKLKSKVFPIDRDSEWITSKARKIVKVLDKEENKVRKYGIDIYEIDPGYEEYDPEMEEAMYQSLERFCEDCNW